jgi:hypothetical protein
LTKHGLQDDVTEINRAGVELAKPHRSRMCGSRETSVRLG